MILTELLWLRHTRVVSLETINLIAIWPGTCWHNVFFMISLLILRRSGFSATGNCSWSQIHWKSVCFTESVCSWVPQGLSAMNEQLQEPSREEDRCLYKWYTHSVTASVSIQLTAKKLRKALENLTGGTYGCALHV